MEKEMPELLKIDFECPACKKSEISNKKIPVLRIIQKLDECFKTNDLNSAKKLLEYWREEALSIGDLQGELSLVNEMLGLYRRTGENALAEKAIVRALELLSLLDMENTVSGATILINAATTSKAIGKAEDAISLYEKAEGVYRETLGDDDSRMAALYNNFATTLTDTGDYERAEKLYKRAIEITSVEIERLPDCAVSYVNLAHMYEKAKGREEPMIYECMERAEEILETQELERNALLAFVSEKCAPSFDYFGYFLFAEKLRKQAREIYAGN
ncbi:MAG: tetratricopeptide repeat protein [Ruminococcaceae bacterium]|nr:tetratricopeptide repeat protein [Oscillospiraceae bacterium]